MVAVGKVAYSWNALHEMLARIYDLIENKPGREALDDWYSTRSDTKSRAKLKGVLKSTTHEFIFPQARADLLWALDEINALADERNDAIHVPCTAFVYPEKDGGLKIGAAFFNGNPRARNLQGKDLIQTFLNCEQWTLRLLMFRDDARDGLSIFRSKWPSRPVRKVI